MSESEPRAGEKVTLDASGSSDPDGNIENYLWDFGADGGSEKTGQQVTWRFETADTTSVRLTVTDSDGAEGHTERDARVQPGVKVGYQYAPEQPRAEEDEVTFDASSSEDPQGQIQNYTWDFDGDESTEATGKTATWTFGYERGDSASVSLTVTGEEDARSVAEKELPLLPPRIALQIEQPRVAQVVQRYEETPVPMVTGRDGLLRVFLRAGQENPYSPDVQVKLFHDGMPVETLTASSEHTVPTDPEVGNLADSWNVLIPSELIQPGLSVLIQADPGDDIPLTDGGQAQFPENGTPLALDVRDTPPLRLTMIPVHVSATGETGNVNGENLDTYLEHPRDLFPISSFDARVRSTYTTNVEIGEGFASTLLSEIEAVRTAEGSERHYYGVFSGGGLGGWGGVAYRPGKAALGVEESSKIMAHELGHNFDQLHTPCGDAPNLDFSYPYPDANIGKYGIKVGERTLLPPSDWKDLMSYCSPQWISDYIYTKILNFRQDQDGTSAKRSSTDVQDTEEPVLLVWGHMTDGKLTLEPAFEINTSPKLPSGSGPHTLRGFDAQGRRLFSFSFGGTEVADGAGGRSFAFAIPRSRIGGDRLARLEVSGNGTSASLRSGTVQEKAQPPSRSAGTFSLQGVGRNAARLQWSDSDYQAIMVRDSHTGEVLSIARNGDTRLRTDGVGTVTLLFSDGVRTTRKRTRVR